MYNKILLTTDGSENAARAAEHALWFAEVSGAPIVILYVVEQYDPRIVPFSTLPRSNESLYEELRDEGNRIVENFKEKLEEIKDKKNYKDITLTTEIKEGKPYVEILKTIKDDFDLIVMGASGRHGLDRYMLGSVTERVVRESTKPVMIIP
jgi:nucleotide-binding universal stress UspA family protein